MDARRYREGKRRQAQQLLGGKCEVCGEEDWVVLQVAHRIPAGRIDASRQPGGMPLFQEIMRIAKRGENPKLSYFLLCANDHVRQTRLQFLKNQLGSGSLASKARREAKLRAARR
jgi:hypothetical protein